MQFGYRGLLTRELLQRQELRASADVVLRLYEMQQFAVHNAEDVFEVAVKERASHAHHLACAVSFGFEPCPRGELPI
jgi:hypothetical protein